MPRPVPPSPRTPLAARFQLSKIPRLALALVAVFLSACAVGCGAPGEPVTRHALTPQPVTDLAGRQQGDAVVLAFTMPTQSTDDKPLAMPPAVEVFRGTIAAGASAPAKVDIHLSNMRLVDTIPSDFVKNYAIGNHVEFPDALDSAEIARAPGEQLIYLVRARWPRGGTSGNSGSIVLPVYPVPEPIRDLRATVTEHAIILAWTPPAQTSAGAAFANPPTYRIYRTEATPALAAGQNPNAIGQSPPKKPPSRQRHYSSCPPPRLCRPNMTT